MSKLSEDVLELGRDRLRAGDLDGSMASVGLGRAWLRGRAGGHLRTRGAAMSRFYDIAMASCIVVVFLAFPAIAVWRSIEARDRRSRTDHAAVWESKMVAMRARLAKWGHSYTLVGCRNEYDSVRCNVLGEHQSFVISCSPKRCDVQDLDW